MDPIVGVGAIVVDGDELLMIRRGRGPAQGTWSVPGGRVIGGEQLEVAVVREVFEETGNEVFVSRFVDWTERIDDSDAHYVILDFECQLAGERRSTAGDDAAEVKWVTTHEVADMNLVDGLAEFLHANGVIPTIA